MPRITSKGQITIPLEIRNRFGFMPGMEIDIVVEDNKALIVKSRQENRFLNWLGRGETGGQQRIDSMIDQIRGRTDE